MSDSTEDHCFSLFKKDENWFVRNASVGDIEVRPDSADLKTAGEVLAANVYGPALDFLRSRSADSVRNVVDLGANIGLSSALLLRSFPNANVICIEPDRSNIAILKRNIERLQAGERAQLAEAALWHTSGTVWYHEPQFATNTNEGMTSDSQGSYQVRAVTIQEIANEHGLEVIDLLKLDIEGAEEHLFAGTTDWIDMTTCIAAEFHGDTRATSRFDETIREHGFRIDDESNPHTVFAFRD